MKKVLSLTAFLFLAILLMSCSQKLTDDQAIELIRKSRGYPRVTTTPLWPIQPNSPIAQEILTLVAEGYMLPQKSYWEGYEITEKGKGIVKECQWNSRRGEYSCTFFTHKADIVKIKKMLTDSKKGTAIIVYEVAYKLTPYGEKLISLGGKIEREKKGYERTIRFKKYDQGWVEIE
jgi:hypothetical protein